MDQVIAIYSILDILQIFNIIYITSVPDIKRADVQLR